MADSSKEVSTEKVHGTPELIPGSDSDAPVVAVLQETPKRSWKSYIWDTFDKSPEERKFLFKLDAALMTLASLGYFIKYLDQVCESRRWLCNETDEIGQHQQCVCFWDERRHEPVRQ